MWLTWNEVVKKKKKEMKEWDEKKVGNEKEAIIFTLNMLIF